MLIDSLFKPYDAMRRVMEMQQPFKIPTTCDDLAKPHDCGDCPSGDPDGCENCQHDWHALPNSGQQCSRCKSMP